MSKTFSNTDEFAQMGIAALLPGMTYMLELMTTAIKEKRDLLGLLQEGLEKVTPLKKRLGRPKGSKNRSGRYGWSTDPEERKAEAARRQAVRKKKATAKMHPRDPNHPEHALWAAKMAKAQKKVWKNMSVAQRKERLAKMAASHTKPALQAVAS